MFKKSKLLVILLALALIPATASATITRVIGFGGEQAGFVIKDASNPVLFPSTLVYYPHLLYAEFAPDSSGTYLDRVGAWYGFGEGKCVLGFDVFNRNKTGYSALPEISPGVRALPYRLNVRWARPFGNFTLGAALSIYQASQKLTNSIEDTSAEFAATDTSRYSASNRDDSEGKGTIVGFDLGATALDNNLDVALGFEFPSGKTEENVTKVGSGVGDYWSQSMRSVGGTLLEDDGSSMLRFAARYWYNYGERTTLIPNFEVTVQKDAYKASGEFEWDSTAALNNHRDNFRYRSSSSSDYSATTTGFRLGLGHNWKPAKDVLVVFDVGIRFSSAKYESKWASQGHAVDTLWSGSGDSSWQDGGYDYDHTADWTDLPYWRLGWEGQVFKWLKLRGGAEKIWKTLDDDDEGHYTGHYYYRYGSSWNKSVFGWATHSTTKSGKTYTNMYFGGDFLVGPVVIQYLLDQDFVRRGPYFISGVEGALFHRFSLFYKIPQ